MLSNDGMTYFPSGLSMTGSHWRAHTAVKVVAAVCATSVALEPLVPDMG